MSLDSAPPDYKKLYERLVKTVDKLSKQRDAYYAVEEAFFVWMEKRFDNEYYRELWNELEDIACACYVREEFDESVMEKKFDRIDIDYYFPPKSEEEETEENYQKYRG